MTLRSERFCSQTQTHLRVSAKSSRTRRHAPVSKRLTARSAPHSQPLSKWLTDPKTSRLHRARRLVGCGAHGAPPDTGAGARPFARPTDGGAEESQRHPREARTAEEGSEVRRRLHRADLARAARVRFDRKGFR